MKSLWSAITAPSRKISDPERSRRAYLLSSILLPYTALVLVTVEFGNYLFPQLMNPQTYLIGHASVLWYAILYLVSRTRFFQFASIGMIAGILISVFSVAYVDQKPETIHAAYGWLSIATLIASFVFTLPWAILVATANVAGILAFGALMPDTHFKSVIIDLPVTLFMGVLTITAAILRAQAEREVNAARERAETANRNKSRFLASMSHEIRSPLGVVLGFTDLLTEQDLKREDKEKFRDMVRRSGDHLMELINEILDLTKVESNRLEIRPNEVNLRREVESIVELHRPLANRKGLEIELAIGDEVPELIISDALRLRQALHNLLTNAIKFTERGAITLLVNGSGRDIRFIVD
ncbi:MAG: histidine kinase dimerization/phospho-acceptor domain-containing protein, partial [Bdellovibrionia bacterium]